MQDGSISSVGPVIFFGAHPLITSKYKVTVITYAGAGLTLAVFVLPSYARVAHGFTASTITGFKLFREVRGVLNRFWVRGSRGRFRLRSGSVNVRARLPLVQIIFAH